MAKTEAKPEATAEEGGDNRHVMVLDPKTKKEVKRVDYIKSLFSTPGTDFYGNRGNIARHLSEIAGKKIPYQIVFAATKDKESKAIAAKRKAEADAAAEAE